MNRTARLLVPALVVLAACSDAAVEPTSTTAPETTTTTSATTTTTAPTTTSTTSSTTTSSTTTTSATTTTTLPPLEAVTAVRVADGLDRPIYVTAPAEDPRLFVVERTGHIRLLAADGTLQDEPFLDARDVVNSYGIEQGLLGLAFHPDYPIDPRFFVYYTDDDDDTRLAEYRVSPDDPGRASPDGRVLLTIDQPTLRHNAGMLQFAPDGMLWIAVGDGGDGGTHGQDPSVLLGTILRIDVGGDDPYGVPSDNPFVSGGGAPEVWAFGLRNPWRIAIDAVARLLYVADVGQSDLEEIDVLSLDEDAGANLGWPRMEGSNCFKGPDCDDPALILPVVEYSHDDGCSVSGGFVYRGAAIPEIDGHYFYADWCRGWIRSFRYEEGEAVDARDWTDEIGRLGQVNSFGLDAFGELYVTTWDGDVFRLEPVRGG